MLIPIPSLLDTETIRDALLRDTGVRRAMARLATCTVALVGIGSMDTIWQEPESESSPGDAAEGAADARGRSGRRRQRLPATPDELVELRAVGAVGEICARFFDVEGRPCNTTLDRRMVALDLRQLREVPLVVGVAYGRQKDAAILGAVRGGYVKSLVTDDATATAVLALARSSRDVAMPSPVVPIDGDRRPPGEAI